LEVRDIRKGEVMSPLAWRILALFIDHVQRIYKGEYGRGYIPAWTLGELVGGDAATIQAVTTRLGPRNEYEQALKELLDLGIVEELPMLHERFQLVVREQEKS
jgi:hypothetical protein